MRPTEPGWYWFNNRYDDTDQWIVVQVHPSYWMEGRLDVAYPGSDEGSSVGSTHPDAWGPKVEPLENK